MDWGGTGGGAVTSPRLTRPAPFRRSSRGGSAISASAAGRGRFWAGTGACPGAPSPPERPRRLPNEHAGPKGAEGAGGRGGHPGQGGGRRDRVTQGRAAARVPKVPARGPEETPRARGSHLCPSHRNRAEPALLRQRLLPRQRPQGDRGQPLPQRPHASGNTGRTRHNEPA
ncbi:cuticle collagen 7-like [Camarhynchus parvulus]|uniref:cuticle collagen 7-like n=1 Tax=Geospiza parvula TaxID=87175 RepID=UPI001237E49F|nr:cuticle collagen 7-like [Camarhynchus parvulus]